MYAKYFKRVLDFGLLILAKRLFLDDDRCL